MALFTNFAVASISLPFVSVSSSLVFLSSFLLFPLYLYNFDLCSLTADFSFASFTALAIKLRCKLMLLLVFSHKS